MVSSTIKTSAGYSSHQGQRQQEWTRVSVHLCGVSAHSHGVPTPVHNFLLLVVNGLQLPVLDLETNIALQRLFN